MIKFMDGIVEAVEQFIEGVRENTLIILGILAKIVILLTTPVWILPYKLVRDIIRVISERSKKNAGNND